MEERLYIKLVQWRRRQQWVTAVQCALRGGWWGGWLTLATMLLLAALGRPVSAQAEALWLWPTLLCAGFLYGLLRPLSLRQVAREVDRAHNLQERLLTCYANVLQQQRHDLVSRLLLEDTVQRVESLDPRQTFPNRWQRPLLRWSVPLLSVLLATTLLSLRPAPAPDPFEQEVLASRERLARLARRWETRRTRPAVQRQLSQLLQRLPRQVPQQAARHMRQQRQRLEQQLAAQAELALQAEQLAQQARQARTPTARAALHKQLEQLQRQLEARHSAQPELQKAREQLRQGQVQQAEKALQQAAEKLAGGEEAQQTSELAQALSDEMQQLGPQSGSGADQPAQGPVAAAPGPGQAGQGNQPGNPDFGKGTTNQAEGQSRPAQPKSSSLRQNKETRQKEAEYARLYGPERQHVGLRRERARMQGAKGKLLRMPDSQLGSAREGDPSLRPEHEDFLAAKVLAEQSVAEEQIPPEHREAVRRYFEQIDPR